MKRSALVSVALSVVVAACSGEVADRTDMRDTRSDTGSSATSRPSGSIRQSVDSTRWLVHARRLATPAATFEAGRGLVERNCADCMHATADSLRMGIGYLLGALEGGYEDTAAVYESLIQGYNTQTFVHASDSAEQSIWHARWRHALATLAAQRPDDVDAEFAYAISHESDAERRAALRRLLARDSLHLPGNAYLGLLLADADSMHAAIPHFRHVVRRGNTRHAEYRSYMRRICAALESYPRNVDEIDRMCRAPGYGATFLMPTGLAVSDTAGGWCAMFLADSTHALSAGQVIAVVFGDSTAPTTVTTVVRGRRSAQCHAAFPQPRWHDYVGYDLEIFAAPNTAHATPAVGLAIGYAGGWSRGVDGVARADLDGDGSLEEVRRCAADEGEHFTLWRIRPDGQRVRLWHEYYDWGALVEHSCEEGEDGRDGGGA